jgi:hypothetical protein
MVQEPASVLITTNGTVLLATARILFVFVILVLLGMARHCLCLIYGLH